MARFEKIGCFGLTEPLVGLGVSGGLLTTAKARATPHSQNRREALDRQCSMVRRFHHLGA